MFQIAEQGPVTRLHMARRVFGRALYTVNGYQVDGLLIDTGCPGTARRLLAWCCTQPIRQVVNTHRHEDHSGGNFLLRQILGLRIAAPPDAVPILARFPRLQFYRHLVWGQPKGVAVESLGNAVET